MSEFILPGQYKLLSAVLVSDSAASIELGVSGQGNSNEFSGFIPVFVIEESINSDCIKGYAEIVDNIGFLEDLPIRGEEHLIFTIEDAMKNRRIYQMRIYKIQNVEINDANDGLRYEIHFVSKSRFNVSARRITEPFEDKISNIASTIFNSYYSPPQNSSSLVVEPTEGIFRCVIPNYTPVQAMNFLSQRAYSTSSPSCSFRFFETVHNHFFVSDEYLINQALKNVNNIKEFTYSDALDKSGEEYSQQMQNFITIKNEDRVNTMKDLGSGAYRSHVIEIDLVRGRVNLPTKSTTHSYNFETEKTKYLSTSGRNTDEGIHSPEFKSTYFTQENEKRYMVIRDYADDSGEFQLRGNQFLPEIVANRTAYRHHLNNTMVNATANGRLDLNAGGMINIKIPQFVASSKKGLNPQLSGYYMIDTVTHNFVRDVHTTALKLIKYDWNTT